MPKGCDVVMKERLGRRYSEKKAYAVLLENDYTDIWSLKEWHSVCITFSGSNSLLQIYVDGLFKTSHNFNKEEIRSENIYVFQGGNNNKNPIAYQVQTEITDLNIWDSSMSKTFIEQWSKCELELREGNYLNWSGIHIDDNIQSYSLEYHDICFQPDHFIVHPQLMDFTETKNFCTKMGGSMAVARNNQTLNQMIALFRDVDGSSLEKCQDGFFIGYTDEKEEGSWVSIKDGTSMTLGNNWADGYPTNNPDFNQAVYRDGKIFDGWERKSHCPICSISKQTLFELDNICVDEENVDKFYLMVNSSYFLGLAGTRLYKNESIRAWVIETTDESKEIASLAVPEGEEDGEFIPTGIHTWSYSMYECNGEDHENWGRPMNLHLNIDRPGHFCCSDGTCIDSELLCDGNEDCSDDEHDYNDRIVMKNEKRGTEASQETEVLVNVSIMDLLGVSLEKSTFTVFFWIKLEWKNSNLVYKFLHEDFRQNNSVFTVATAFFHFPAIFTFTPSFFSSCTLVKLHKKVGGCWKIKKNGCECKYSIGFMTIFTLQGCMLNTRP